MIFSSDAERGSHMKSRTFSVSVIVVILLLCAILSSCFLEAPQAEPGSISGNVDVENNTSDAGVLVTARSTDGEYTYTALSDEEGNYVLSDVSPATYNLTFSKTDYSTIRRTVTVGSGESVSMKKVTLSPPPINIPCTVKWAGIRVSRYGMRSSFGKTFPSVSDMVGFGQKMESCYEGSTGAYLLIVGTISSNRDDDRNIISGDCSLEFPLSGTVEYARGSKNDSYEDYLTAMDEAGLAVWLQVEPGDADLVELATEVLNHYKHHPCVKGFGIDVEWYKYRKAAEAEEGDSSKLSNEVAAAVVAAARAINPDYTVFVKHWDTRWLPSTYRDGLIFVNDSQGYDSAREQRDDYAQWAAHYAPSPVMFQIGYRADKDTVWGKYSNPAKELGQYIVAGCRSGNDVGIIWVDFTLKDVIDKIEAPSESD